MPIRNKNVPYHWSNHSITEVPVSSLSIPFDKKQPEIEYLCLPDKQSKSSPWSAYVMCPLVMETQITRLKLAFR